MYRSKLRIIEKKFAQRLYYILLYCDYVIYFWKRMNQDYWNNNNWNPNLREINKIYRLTKIDKILSEVHACIHNLT